MSSDICKAYPYFSPLALNEETMSHAKNIFNLIQDRNINPYYKNFDRNTLLFNDDCRNMLKKIPENSIDMIFADPPYFGNQSGLLIKRTDGHTDTFNTQKAVLAYSKPLKEQFEFQRQC